MISRSAENTVGGRLRSSSVKVPPGSGMVTSMTSGPPRRRIRRRPGWPPRVARRGPAPALAGRWPWLALAAAPADAGPAQRGGDDREQDAAALVQRRGRDPPAPGDDLDARVDVGDVPAAVAARVLHPGAEHAAPALVDLPGDVGQQGRIERGGDPADPHPARGNELAGRRASRCRTAAARAAVAGCVPGPSVPLAWGASRCRARRRSAGTRKATAGLPGDRLRDSAEREPGTA